MQQDKTANPIAAKQAPAVPVGTEPKPEAAPASKAASKPGRHDAAYRDDQAAQRRADTRFDSSKYRRKQDTAAE